MTKVDKIALTIEMKRKAIRTIFLKIGEFLAKDNNKYFYWLSVSSKYSTEASHVKAVKTSKGSLLTACLACSLLCYWIHAFFGLGLFLVSPLMWLTWGLFASGLHPREVKCSIEPETVTEINLI